MVFLFLYYCICCSGVPCPCRDRLHICVCYAREGKVVIASGEWESEWLDTKLGDPGAIGDAIKAWLALGSRLATTLKACRVEVLLPAWAASPVLAVQSRSLPPPLWPHLPATTHRQIWHPAASDGCCQAQTRETAVVTELRGKVLAQRQTPSGKHFSCRLCCHPDPAAGQPCPCPMAPAAPTSPVKVRQFANLSILWRRCMSSSYSDGSRSR